MNKRIFTGLLIASILLLGACGKSEESKTSSSASKSTTQSGDLGKSVLDGQTASTADAAASASTGTGDINADGEVVDTPEEGWATITTEPNTIEESSSHPEISTPTPPSGEIEELTSQADPEKSKDDAVNVLTVSTLELMQKIEETDEVYVFIGRPSSKDSAAFKKELENAIVMGAPEGTTIVYLNTDVEKNDEDFQVLLEALNVAGVPTLMRVLDLNNFSFYDGDKKAQSINTFLQQ